MQLRRRHRRLTARLSFWTAHFAQTAIWVLRAGARLGLCAALLVGAGCDPKKTPASGCTGNTDCPSGQVCGAGGQCVPKPKTIVVTITRLGEGQGQVTSDPIGLACDPTCSANFELGKPVTLTAVPQQGSLVDGWSIGCSSVGATCTFTPTEEEPIQVGVHFSLAPPVQPPPLCNAAGFCWENPRPQGNRLHDVAVLPSAEVWAVGEAGTIVRRTGTTSALVNSNGWQTLFGIAAVGTDAVIVGQGATVLRASSGVVFAEAPGVTQDLFDVTAVSGGAVAVGANGKIVRRSGVAWSSDTSPTTQTLRAVSPSGSELYAVGDAGTVVAYSGSSWRVVTDSLFGSKSLTSVASLGNSAYIGSTTGEVFRQGSPWSRVCCTNLPDILGLSGSSQGLLAVGFTVGGTIFNSPDGANWSTVMDGASTAFRRVRWSGSEAWVVGDAGAMLRTQTGQTFTPISAGATAPMYAVAGNEQGYFAAGRAGVLLRSSGTNVLSFTASGTPDFYGVCKTTTDAWAVGAQGSVYQFTGTAWQKFNSGVSTTLRAVFCPGPGEAWVVGDAGTVLHIKDAKATVMSAATSQQLLSVWGVGSQDIWAVGALGTVVRYQGAAFVPFTAPATTRAITSVWGNLSSNVFLVAGPDVFAWNGNNYQKYTPTGGDLAAVGGYGAETYVTGGFGQLFRFVGAGFTPVETGTRNPLYAVAVAASKLWVVGEGGTVLSKTR